MTGIDRFLVRFKAIDTPFYQETRPSADLRHIVACLWVRVVRLGGTPGPSAIIPDACADVMVFDDAPPFVAGPDATTRWTTLHEGTVITGIRLRPGTVRSIFGFDAGLIVDGGAPLADLAPGARPLHQRLLATTDLRHRHTLLEDWVRARLARGASDGVEVVAACRLLGAPDAGSHFQIDEIARRFQWTSRTLHRRVRAACGYGPKHLQRILRVQRALRVFHDSSPTRLTDLAHATGYADHAHMTRDFRDITGFSPRQYLASSGPEWSAWIGDAW